MKKFPRWMSFVLLLITLIGWGVMRVSAEPVIPPDDPFLLLPEPSSSVATAPPMKKTSAGTIIPYSTGNDRAWKGDLGTFPSPPTRLSEAQTLTPQQGEVTCQQLLLNPQLDVLELGDGTGRAEPWVIFDPNVYYTDQTYVSADHSLSVKDADTDDTPTQDAFAQAFYMPTKLITVTIHYYTTAADANSADQAFGNLWTVTADGDLEDSLGSWEVGEYSSGWQGETVLVTDPSALEPMEGERLAIILFNLTDGEEPGERVRFDDVTLTACASTSPTSVYLPILLRNYGTATGPICRPPSENPQDQWNANRGYVEADSTCNSTLSKIDLADYYTFVAPRTEDYTLHLQNLPADTEWAAMVFVDQAEYPPPFAPGPTDGDCRIAEPGSGDKSVICPLEGGKSYFVKVSAGAGYSGPEGDYQMQVASSTGPTPTPTPTPTAEPSGIYGQVTLNGAPANGVDLLLRYYDGSSWSTQATDTTNSSGEYLFTGVPSLGSGQKYYVRYDNPSSTSNGRLWVWYGADITSYTSGSQVHGGDFDIKDISLQSPSNGSSVTLPHTFSWSLRGISSDDHYQFFLYDPVDDNLVYIDDLEDQVTINGLPSGWPSGRTYGWWTGVCQDANCDAYGWAFETWSVTINSAASTGEEGDSTSFEPVSPSRGKERIP